MLYQKQIKKSIKNSKMHICVATQMQSMVLHGLGILGPKLARLGREQAWAWRFVLVGAGSALFDQQKSGIFSLRVKYQKLMAFHKAWANQERLLTKARPKHEWNQVRTGEGKLLAGFEMVSMLLKA